MTLAPTKTTKDREIEEYVECVKSIPVPSYVVIDADGLKKVVAEAFHNDLQTKQVAELLREVVSIDWNKWRELGGLHGVEDIVNHMADAILLCKEYAVRYRRCRGLEKSGASPDDVEVCYEVADKMKKPIFITLW